MTAKTIELMNLAELFHQLRGRNAISQLPAGTVIHLAERETNKASFQQIRVSQDAAMRNSIENKMLVYFVGVNKNFRIGDNGSQLFHIGGAKERPRRVVRSVEQDHSRPRSNGAADLFPVDPVIGKTQIDTHSNRSIDLDIRNIAVIGRFKDNNLVAGLQHGCKRRIDR